MASSASVATNAKIGSASKRTAGPICLLGVIPNPHFQERHFVSAAHSFGTLFITDRFTCLSSLYHAIGIKSVIVCRQLLLRTLAINKLIQNNFFSLGFQCVHQSHPLQRIRGFQFFRRSGFLGHFRHHLFHSVLSGFLNLPQVRK